MWKFPKKDIRGVAMPTIFTDETILAAMDHRPGDGELLVATYPKCGTTWVSHIVGHLLCYGVDGPADGMEVMQKTVFLEMEGTARLDSENCFAKTHLPFDKSTFNPKAKYIWVVRNPRDTCVSYYHHVKNVPVHLREDDVAPKTGFFNDFAEEFIKGEAWSGDYFDHLLGWYSIKQLPNVLTIVYEEMKKDPKGHIVKIAEFIGGKVAELAKNPKVLDEIQEVTTVKKMQEAINPHIMEIVPAHVKQNMEDPDGPVLFIRKGIVGDWKNHFTPELEEKFKAWIASKPEHQKIMDLFKVMAE